LLVKGTRKKEKSIYTCIYVSPSRSHSTTSEISNMHTAREIAAFFLKIFSWQFKLHSCTKGIRNKFTVTSTEIISLSKGYIFWAVMLFN
jgi:hypothetical protein